MRKTFFATMVLIASVPNADAGNYVFLLGKDVGGEMSCSDWQRPKTNSGKNEKAAMVQWVFGFISGYDDALRPYPSGGSLNGQTIVELISKLCKENPGGHLLTVARSIATYLQREVKGEVSSPIILNK